MHPKLKSTVSGLVVVAVFVFGSALVGEPLPPAAAGPTAAEALEQEAARVALALDQAQAAAETARRATLRRLHLTMPYFAPPRVAVTRILPAVES